MAHDNRHPDGDIPTGGASGPASGPEDVFQEVDEDELRHQVGEGIQGSHAWGEIAPPTPMVPPQEPYPNWPGDLERVLGAISRKTGASRSTTAAALLPAVATLTSFHYDVVTLASKPSPTSWYACAISESTWRKSTAASEAWDPHLRADAAVSDRHTQVVEEAKDRAKSVGRGKPDDEAEGPAPRDYCPIALRSDDTIEVVRIRLVKGRPVLFQALDEAAVTVRGFSLSGERLVRSLGIYSTLWTGVANGEARIGGGVGGVGREVYLKGGAYAFNVSWLGQKSVLTPVITSEAAAMGMSGRMLVAWDSVRPGVGEKIPGDDAVVDLYQAKVFQWRELQDRETVFRAWELPDRQTIGMTAPAMGRLHEYNRQMMMAADSLLEDGRLLEQGAAGRAAEMAARLAGVFAAWEAWPMVRDGAGNVLIQEPSGTADQPQVDLDLIEATMAIVEWHRRELRRVVDAAGATDKVRVMDGAVRVIAEAVADPARFNRSGQRLVDSHGHITLQTLLATYGPAAVRGDVDYKTDIIEALVQERYVWQVEGERGRFAVHPNISRAVRRRGR